MPKTLLLVFTLLFWSVQTSAQLPERWTEPVPLSTGEGEAGETNANRILFFPHPAVEGATVNFRETLTSLHYGEDLEENVFDLIGTPGFPVLSEVKRDPENMGLLLEDPAGLCMENFLIGLLCRRDWIVGEDRHGPSWQLLVADLRNYLPGEARLAGLPSEVAEVTLSGQPDWGPYQRFGLSALVATTDERLAESPPAVCYDVAFAEDWIACPVFGKIYVRGYTPLRPVTVGGEAVEIQNPIIIYHLSDEDGLYHLAGYLANPVFPLHYDLYDQEAPGVPNRERRVRRGSTAFPMSIAVGNFVTTDAELLDRVKAYADIAVMGTATLPYARCRWFAEAMTEAGLDPLPWDRSCTYGLVWTRVRGGWDQPVRELFDSQQTLIGAPKIYSMAAGYDVEGGYRLFAASNAADAEGKFYVLKYYDQGTFRRSMPSWIPPSLGPPELVAPRLIEVIPPGGGAYADFGPFRIVTAQLNGDGYADFAITWKKTQDQRSSTENRIWKGTYAPYFSLFLSRAAGATVEYIPIHFEVPGAEIASVAFGQKDGQRYLAAGNNKRVQTDGGEYHAFVHVFPIGEGGLLNTVQAQTVKVSSKPGPPGAPADAPGVGDLAASPDSHVIAAALRDPFLPAPESCNLSEGVYGHGWLGEVRNVSGTTYRLDADGDGMPNRCEICNGSRLWDDPQLLDEDGDEVPDACEVCAGEADLDSDRDGFVDCVDNCPPSRCEQYPEEGFVCSNTDQADEDGDEAGDSCDGCPDQPDFALRGNYIFGLDNCEECFPTHPRGCISEYETCSYCLTGYLNSEGEPIGPLPNCSDARRSCDEFAIEAPGSYAERPEFDIDQDGVPDVRDNCVHIYNPPPASYRGSVGNLPSGQADFDGDGSGDLCDPPARGGCGEADDCDKDGIPNRFDRETPTGIEVIPASSAPGASYQPPDTIYDPRAPYIADRRQLKLAQGFDVLGVRVDSGLIHPSGFSRPLWDQTRSCGYPGKTWPGPRPCDHMGRAGKEVTVILPVKTETPPPCEVGVDPECTVDCDPETGTGCPPCVPGTDPECTEPPVTGRNVVQYCVAHSRTALTALEQEAIDKANKEIAAITGLENFDIIVGSETGAMHYECALLGGVFQPEEGESAARGLSLGPGGSPPPAYTALAPYALFQTAGLPPHIQYETRPDPALAIAPSRALLIGPVPSPSDEGTLPSLALPSLGAALPADRSGMTQVPAERLVQWSQQGQNVNKRLIYQILTPNQAVSTGMSLSVGALHSLFVMDVKAPPEPFSEVPVEAREDKIELLISKLEEKTGIWRREGRDTRTPEIYVGLPWEKPMAMEFYLVQNTVPEAVSAARAGDPSLASDEVFDEGFVHRLVLPAYVKAPRAEVVGGCGCRLPGREFSILSLLYLLCLLTPVPVLLYYRKRHRR